MEWASEISPALWIAGFLALYMAWAIGANDVANAMGTSVGSGALTVWGAILVAGIFEFCGAFFAGGVGVAVLAGVSGGECSPVC